MTDLDKNLEATWGQLAQHSEYKRNDVIPYRVGDVEYTGKIVWIAAPRESHIGGHAMLPTRYIVERQGWDGFPDVVYSSDILTK
jgi:hypothetical protein